MRSKYGVARKVIAISSGFASSCRNLSMAGCCYAALDVALCLSEMSPLQHAQMGELQILIDCQAPCKSAWLSAHATGRLEDWVAFAGPHHPYVDSHSHASNTPTESGAWSKGNAADQQGADTRRMTEEGQLSTCLIERPSSLGTPTWIRQGPTNIIQQPHLLPL